MDEEEKYERKCWKCQRVKGIMSFSPTRGGPDGRESMCRSCKNYPMLSAQCYDEMLIEQAGRCEICREPMREPALDHDHACGPRGCKRCIRAFLCRSCNFILGIAKDDPARLRGCAEYVERFKKAA